MASYDSTIWRNPSTEPAKLTFFLAPGESASFTVPANGTAQIPTTFDRAIHDIRGGVIVGGAGPFLTRDGQTERVHRALGAGPAVALAEPQAAPLAEPGKPARK